MYASTCAIIDNIFSVNSLIFLPTEPCNWRWAISIERSERARIKSAIASAWLRSRFPFKKALRVNSPGSAARQPRAYRSSNMF